MTNIKNTGLLKKIQDSDNKDSAVQQKLRAILPLRWTALKTN